MTTNAGVDRIARAVPSSVGLPNGRPRILMSSGNYRFTNMGDVAMLQVAVARLRELLPQATIGVVTWDEAGFGLVGQGASAVLGIGRDHWLSDSLLLGSRLHRLLPGVSVVARRWHSAMRRRMPKTLEHVVRWRLALTGHDTAPLNDFLQWLDTADVVFLSGAGGFTDHARIWALPVLELFESAIRRQATTVMMGQGIGPLYGDEELEARMRAVLPRTDFLALREQVTGGPILQTMGVPAERVHLTGDDAIEPAFEARPAVIGGSVGVCIRCSTSSQVDAASTAALGKVIQAFADRNGAPIVPLPIDPSDAPAIRAMLGDAAVQVRDEWLLDSPQSVIRQAGRCRVVVTGAYHAAVFALSQGISTVCLTRSKYFNAKFKGLANQFGDGCYLVALDAPDPVSTLDCALAVAWEKAPALRNALLEAATRQIESGWQAYRDVAVRILQDCSRRAATSLKGSGSPRDRVSA